MVQANKKTQTTTFSDDFVMPSAKESESAILCCLMLDNSLFPQVLGRLATNDFYVTSHRKIYDACVYLHSQGKEVNPVTLVDDLRQKQELESVGGVAYLASLVQSYFLHGSLESFIVLVKEASTRRKLIRQNQKIVSMAFDGTSEIEELLAETKKSFDLAGERFQEEPIIDTAQAAWDRLHELEEFSQKDAEMFGVPTGFRMLDMMTCGWQSSDLIILAARPSEGKSSLALNLAESAVAGGKNVAFFSLEMPRKQLVDRLLCSLAQVDPYRYRRFLINREEAERLGAAQQHISQLPGKLFIEEKMRTVSAIRARCALLKSKGELGLVVVDYAQLVQPESKKDTRNQEVEEVVNGLKAIALEFDVPVIALSQMSRSIEQRIDRRPQLSDLRESGAIEQTADVVLFIHAEREAKEQAADNNHVLPVTLIIGKQRNGPIGDVPMVFFKQFTRFQSAA